MTHPNAHPPINFEKLGEVDPARFAKALDLEPVPMDAPGQYRVRYPNDPLRLQHYVDLVSADVPRCDCGDFLYREVLCKHILACLLHINHPIAAAALVAMMATRRKGSTNDKN